MLTIPGVARAAADRFGTRTALVDGDRRVSYRGLYAAAHDFGAAVAGSGVGPGDRVAIWCYNCLEWVVSLLGVSMAGATLVPINTRFKGAEAADILTRSAAKLLIRRVLDATYAQTRSLTAAAIAERRISPEGQEGLRSFLERRKASFVRE